jgi:hypothetical protein
MPITLILGYFKLAVQLIALEIVTLGSKANAVMSKEDRI